MSPQALYERRKGNTIRDGMIDGTEDLLGEDTLETDWDLAGGAVPPPGFWNGTHTREGSRIPGFIDEEYQEGESW
ncbi:hypothetical protein LPW11_16395 [Geomonas sp. RF6]|uniref:hypothetical protein n=1 Tax=Geomonas sp. RF6 TaxID=2897342 RepID=UPI001E51EA28|nr:hypothetical protein [Geomonas sp. RF6]UFS69467.1 hypothetical protein LPW11_16395 [Geomonas sp. RF6]